MGQKGWTCEQDNTVISTDWVCSVGLAESLNTGLSILFGILALLAKAVNGHSHD